MPHEYDQQLLEAVRVRRERLAAALLYGANPQRRAAPAGLRSLLAGLTLAAVIAAGCVGFSFVVSLLPQLARPSAGPVSAQPAASAPALFGTPR